MEVTIKHLDQVKFSIHAPVAFPSFAINRLRTMAKTLA